MSQSRTVLALTKADGVLDHEISITDRPAVASLPLDERLDQYEREARELLAVLRTKIPSGTWDVLLRLLVEADAADHAEL
jgi:hypothetical protein